MSEEASHEVVVREAEGLGLDVLVVDDEPSVRGFIARVLTLNGYSCRTANDVSEALSETIRQPPVLTISDVRMPGKDGTWLLNELKKRWPDMGVIMLTGVADAKTAVQCLRDGADDYLVKPIDLDELLISVKRATERERLVRETRESRQHLEVMQARSARLRDALEVIESTYQEALGAFVGPGQSLALARSPVGAAGHTRDASEWEQPKGVTPATRGTEDDSTAELSALRVAGKLIGEGVSYRDVAAGIAKDLVSNGGLTCAGLWTTRAHDGVSSIVELGSDATSGSLEIKRVLSSGVMQVNAEDDSTRISCPVFLKGVPVDVLQLGWRASQTPHKVEFAERLSLILAVALARDHEARDRQRIAEELDLFYKLAAESRHALELEHVAEFLLGSIHRIVDYDAAGLLLLSDDPSLVIQTRFASSAGFTERVRSHVLTNLKLTFGVEAPAGLRTTEREIVGDGPHSPRPEPPKLRSFVNVPLTVGGGVVGLIHVSSGRDHAFSEEEVRFVHRAANFLASSVQGIRDLVAAVKGRVEHMVDHMSDGVLMLDRRGRVVAINGAARQVLDQDDGVEEPMTAEGLAEVLDFDPLEAMEEERRIVRRLVCLRGVAFQAQLTPIVDDEGTLTGAVVAFRNFEQEKRVDELKSELVNVVSHELRTPLTAINNAVNLLRGTRLGELTDEQGHFLELTQRNVEQLIAIINDLLDLSKIEAGKMRIDLHAISVSVPVEAAVASLRPQAEAKGVILECRIAPDIPLVHGDSASLQRVLVNLLGNAIKFTDRGRLVAAEVEMTEIDHGDGRTKAVQVSVADSGIGIPEDQLESIFDKFHQVRGDNRHTTTVGTGLGLPISRELIKAHHGELWAESSGSGGSRFSFVIPVLTDIQLLFRVLSIEIGRAREHDTPLALAVARFTGADQLKEDLGDEGFHGLLDELRKSALGVVRRSTDQVLTQRDEAQIAVILPQTPKEGGRVFETRLRDEMQNSSLAGKVAQLAVSWAVVPDDAVSAEELYAFASHDIGEAALA